MRNSIKNGNLAQVAEHDEELCDYRQVGSEFPECALGHLYRLRRNFKHHFGEDLFYLVPEEGNDVYFYVEDLRVGEHENELMYHWIMGFIAHGNPIPATFVPEPEGNQDVHTEHCCVEHGCKYGDSNCPVELGTKSQSFPCMYCDGGEDTWGQ